MDTFHAVEYANTHFVKQKLRHSKTEFKVE